MNPTLVAIIKTYLRAFIAAVLAAWLAGVNEPKALLYAGITAIAGPLLKWLDPSEPAYGRTREVHE